MGTGRFSEHMQAFGQWKARLIDTITDYQRWLDETGLRDPEDELRLFELQSSLRVDRLTVAFVAEFARGKTELINAIFFSEYDRRLLPSEPGRTTMCPTELFYDNEANESYVRLLPIETRADDSSITEHKQNPADWSTIRLDTASPDLMAEAFQEVIRTKRVSVEEARRLGLFTDDQLGRNEAPPAQVEIPKWRHAMISFPHPLLKQGLSILDTPGLNALGSEPELTLNMLPNAHAVVFVLAADTGVTKSDLEMWRSHVQRPDNTDGLLVVLNKVDTLWDELKEAGAIAASVENQREQAAALLGVEARRIFPVSAQKGLLAKIRHDQALLAKSNVLAIEQVFVDQILDQKQELLQKRIGGELGVMMGAARRLLASRLSEQRAQRDELASLGGKNEQVIRHLMTKTREEQVAYHRSVESFQINRRIFSQQAKRLLAILDLAELDKLMTQTREQMTDSWTTGGVKSAMKNFFDGSIDTMSQAVQQVDQLNKLMQSIYRRFEEAHGLNGAKIPQFSLSKYRKELDQLSRDAEAFRKSPATTMTEQSFVVKKFFISLVSHVRNVFFRAHTEAEAWSRAGLAPLVALIKERKRQMENRLENLRRINESRDTLQGRLDDLERECNALERQLGTIDGLLGNISDAPRGGSEDLGTLTARAAL
ncbi:dynamin family protein [Ectothiorhodospiraceae bacterium 2226]|nr:dynamin family protein [Ectothiorhodospiraceae bacterium 2226]